MASSKQTKPRPNKPKAGTNGGANGQQSAVRSAQRSAQNQNRQAQPRQTQPRQAQPKQAQPKQAQSAQAQTRKARDRAKARELAEERAVAAEAPDKSGVPLWLQLTTLALAIAGLGVSVYMTIEHFTNNATLACSVNSVVNCEAVTTSPESMVFGVLPVAVLGLAFFVFMVPATTPWAWRSRWRAREIALLRLASVIVGVGFILYLLYVELFQVGFICLECTSVHVITFALFVLVALAAAIWGLPEKAFHRRHPAR
ncbi:MAG TPA: vitamin K epoxide reductase family protein [Streptosporangiaceae bacterium]|jgi:uncharacterized membrane protein|nr:vitamin K epoxide reductase family protein [Streptosporangiaceae bacterium]